MADFNLTSDLYSGDKILQMVVREIDRRTIEEIVEKGSKLIADKYIAEHTQEIMDRLSVTEISTLIASAVAQRVAEAYKPKEPESVGA